MRSNPRRALLAALTVICATPLVAHSHLWDMGEWEPDEAFRVEDGEAFLWIVPARIEGRWRVGLQRGPEETP